MDNKKLTPLKFHPQVQQQPWGEVTYCLADLGYIDSLATEGWLSGNNMSDIMETYLERVVGETAFEWYGTQFPVMLKRLTVKGRTPLMVNPDDETAEQRYDAFGKTACWYVQAAGPEAALYLGFKQPATGEAFYRACMDGSVEGLLHRVRPKVGDAFLLKPGMVFAAQDVSLIEVAEASELSFRLHAWGAEDSNLELEEAFDLVNLSAWRKADTQVGESLVTPQFTLHKLPLTEGLRSRRDPDDTFLLYHCLSGEAQIQADGATYRLPAGETLLIPAEVEDFILLPLAANTQLLEVRMDPRASDDIVSEPVDE